MGAIAILLSRAGPPAEQTTRRMLAAAPHRGDQVETESIGQVGLAVCNEPDWVTATLAREDGQAAVLCGTLDNDAELRAELRRAGARGPAASTPASTLLAAFAAWGEDAIPRLRGSFAGAITDGRVVRCFRDQFGAAPMFYHEGAGGFMAATEVKQVVAGAAIPSEPDLDYLHSMLFGGVSRSTAYRGVERIPRCCIGATGPDPGVAVRQYWDPNVFVETARLDQEEAVAGTREALDRAVRRVLTGRDVILLSGGLDSPALAAFAARAPGLSSPVQAATAIYPDHPSADEREWTQMAADHLGMPLHQYIASAGSMDDVEKWVTIMDGPIDVLSIPESAESYTTARSLGARTVLNGEVAEALFGCRAYLLDHLLSHGRLRAGAREIAWKRNGRKPLRIARQIARAVAPPWMIPVRRARTARWVRSLPPWVGTRRMLTVQPSAPLSRRSPRVRWKIMQTAPFTGPGTTFEADELCAASCGVDSRRPFADVDLWEFVLSLPAEVKFPGRSTKPLLRQAMRGLLPDALIDRKDKTYFDEFHLAKADYPELKRLLIEPRHRIDDIDYGVLRDRLEAGDMRIYELQWARNVARVHAFLNRW
jgi:asparagine synthase (glutamine-hydrolysing)